MSNQSTKGALALINAKRYNLQAIPSKIGILYGKQRGRIETRVPEVPALKLHCSNPFGTSSPTTDKSKNQKDTQDDSDLFSLVGPSAMERVVEGVGKIKDFNTKMNLAIKFLEAKVAPQTLVARQQYRHFRRQADKINDKLCGLLSETHKVSFNLHHMMTEIETDEWRLTEFEYNHLFHELRDGSWTYDKVLDENMEPKENFRRQMLIFDVYSKVLLDDVFKNFDLLVHSLSEDKKSILASELEILRKNIHCLKAQLEYLKVRGHIPNESKSSKIWESSLPLTSNIVGSDSPDENMIVTTYRSDDLETIRLKYSFEDLKPVYFCNYTGDALDKTRICVGREDACQCGKKRKEELLEQNVTDATGDKSDEEYFSGSDEKEVVEKLENMEIRKVTEISC